MEADAIQSARRIIASNRYMTLATTDGASPWAAPVAYVTNDRYDFFWASMRDARHSRDIEATGTVAIAIFDSPASYEDVDGVQANGSAEVVKEVDVASVFERYVDRFPMYGELPLENLIDAGRFRFYRLMLTDLYKLDTASPDGDRRMALDIELLRTSTSKSS